MDYNGFVATLSSFICYMSKVLPDDVRTKLYELREEETDALPRLIYDTMFENQQLAETLDRPCCQDTGVIQFFARVGTQFPLLDSLQDAFEEAVRIATVAAPLRHNAQETFDEYNTGGNNGFRLPAIQWTLVRGSELELDIYMAGGGCTLPGRAMVLMPSAGYEGAAKFVLEVMSGYAPNACPPLLVGVGIAASVDTAAILSKKALLRPIGSRNENARAAYMEELLTQAIDEIGFGPQGLRGRRSVMDVHIEHAARHPSTIGVAVNVGCWSHRRGRLVWHADGSIHSPTHRGYCE